MASILAVGNATLDIVNVVSHFPAEDSELRAESQRMVLGGNAANTLHVLGQLNHRSSFVGVLAYDALGHFIKDELTKYGVSTQHCYATQGRTPTSYITLNQENGSRTIVHHRDLPELHATHFCKKINLSDYHWFHFQGRSNVRELEEMMMHVKKNKAPHQRISLEVEKEYDNIEDLFPYADTLFFSKDFVRSRGCDQAELWLGKSRLFARHALRIVAWGRKGAYAETSDLERYSSQAFEPEQVVDTIGAGDTFNAGVIDAQCRGMGVEESLIHACRLAGKKCGQLGFNDLVPDLAHQGPTLSTKIIQQR